MSKILFSIKTENKIFNSFFTEIFVSKMVSKVFNKNVDEKKKFKYLICYPPKFLFLLAFIN